MDLSVYLAFAIIIGPVLCSRGSREDWSIRRNQQQHYKVKREMLGAGRPAKRGLAPAARFRDPRKKEEMEDKDELSVAVGPPPRPKPQRSEGQAAAAVVKSVLTQLTQEFIFKQVDENFVFGQYVGNAMRPLPRDQRLAMQRDIMELILKYSRAAPGQPDKGSGLEGNSTAKDEEWDFTKLDQIVG